MCMRSVSLWAEATWYRLGGGRPESVSPPEPGLSPEPGPELGGRRTAEVQLPAEEPRRERVQTDEKVLVRR